ncbi:MAG TPA: NIPSNAP family protein [Gammaproteobacteria bacterium]|nr:NIPSNAP family protein [Gammaproteobacteria bacterium]
MSRFRLVAATFSVFAAGFVAGHWFDFTSEAQAQARGKVFELRTYTAPEGKLNDLVARFRNDTLRIFEKHGMHNVGYWLPTDAPASSNTLVYILAHDSRDAATKSWAEFRDDPEWKAVAERTQANGPIVTKVDSVFMQATDFSPLK